MLPSAVCVGVSFMVFAIRRVDAMIASDIFAASLSAVRLLLLVSNQVTATICAVFLYAQVFCIREAYVVLR